MQLNIPANVKMRGVNIGPQWVGVNEPGWDEWDQMWHHFDAGNPGGNGTPVGYGGFDTWWKPSLDAAATVGNCVRVIADPNAVVAGRITVDTHVARFKKVIDYALSKGLYVYACNIGIERWGWRIGVDEPVLTALFAAWGDMLAQYATKTPGVIGVDMCNESCWSTPSQLDGAAQPGTLPSSPAKVAGLLSFADTVRTHSHLPVTFSAGIVSQPQVGWDWIGGGWFPSSLPLLKSADFMDFHLYANPQISPADLDKYHSSTLPLYAFSKGKQAIHGEFGVNLSQPNRAAFVGGVAALVSAFPWHKGAILWQHYDFNQASQANTYGLWPDKGQPIRADIAAPFATIPTIDRTVVMPADTYTTAEIDAKLKAIPASDIVGLAEFIKAVVSPPPVEPPVQPPVQPPAPPAPTLTAFDVTDTTANLAWTPADATVTEVGRDGTDSYGGPPWNGKPADLPFRYLLPDTTYELHAVINGVNVATTIKTLKPPAPPSPPAGSVSFGTGDQTAKIQAAFDAIPAGGTLTLAPGTYAHNDLLQLRKDNITVDGGGATLNATNDPRAALVISGANVTVRNLNLTLASGTSQPRLTTNESQKVYVKGAKGMHLQNVKIKYSAAGGFFCYGASNYLIEDCVVDSSRADGFGQYNGSNNGVIRNCTVINGGDDGFSVVTYTGQAQAHDIRFENVTVKGTYWGRGITCVGGDNVTVDGFSVSNTDAAGIYVASEPAAGNPTTGCNNVTFRNGTVDHCNNSTSQIYGAAQVYNGQPANAITNVTWDNITIKNTPKSAANDLGVVRAAGNMSGVVLSRIAIVPGAVPVNHLGKSNVSTPQHYTTSNWTLNGAAYTP